MTDTDINELVAKAKTAQAEASIRLANEIADLICFHSRVRKNGEALMQPWEEEDEADPQKPLTNF